MQNLKPNEQRSQNAIILIWIALAMNCISLVSSYFQYDLLQTAANGGEISIEYATSNDNREQAIGIIQIIVFVVSAITFIQWFRRAYFNLHLRVNHLSETEGWAAGCWFVPIINLFRPYQIMKELFQETHLFLKRNDVHTTEHFSMPSLSLWWTFWIIDWFVGRFVFKYSMKAETIDELTTSTIAEMVSNGIGIVLAIITINIITEYSKLEPLMHKVKITE
ncbi:MAG: DUF4328 domain-containing protein [Flavobacterium sp.]|uniref:DUF4328 domain-containing protein n=1 Tax=Flavobacterium sp. TaxID=239 RepID=UPI002629C444|nr:DUF4328 domain-containing protein [Flavobacterium sp.]MDD5149344.1 DUF4328 domain-containing protein [Flavobacterium sp.]